jgi:hypothetical protein
VGDERESFSYEREPALSCKLLEFLDKSCLSSWSERAFLSFFGTDDAKKRRIQREENERTKIHLSCSDQREESDNLLFSSMTTNQREGGRGSFSSCLSLLERMTLFLQFSTGDE